MSSPEVTEELAEALWSRVEKSSAPNGCWEWAGARKGGSHRYGQIRRGKRLIYTHRLSYELANGPVPAGQYVLHTCDNPPCVRPEHLFSGTPKANTQDMVEKGRGDNVPHPGSRNGFAKLVEAQVIDMRARHAAGESQKALAAEFGVTQANVSLIVRGEAWKHVVAGEAK